MGDPCEEEYIAEEPEYQTVTIGDEEQVKHKEEDKERHAPEEEMIREKGEIQYNRNSDGMIVCPLCPQVFGFRCSFRNHLEKHTPHPTRPLKCDFCPYYTNNKIGISNHARCHKDVGPLTLNAEGSGQQWQSVGQSGSMPPNSNPHKFECSKCLYRTDRAQKLSIHMDYHGKPAKNYIPCPYCNFHASRHGQMTRHLNMHEDAAMGRFPMYYEWENMDVSAEMNQVEGDQDVTMKLQSEQYAAELYGDNDNVENPGIGGTHLRKDFQDFNCEQCPQKLNSLNALTYHMKGHGGDPTRLMKCSMCSYCAKNKLSLGQHFRCHIEELDKQTTEKKIKEEEDPTPQSPIMAVAPVTKETSSTGSANNTSLKSGKIYTCSLCPATFPYGGSLWKHQAKHEPSPDRPFKCNYCTISYSLLKSLKMHEKVHESSPEAEAGLDDDICVVEEDM